MNPEELTGRAPTHLIELTAPACLLHRDAVGALLALRAAAAAAGFDLLPVSSFRDFDRQLAIWNGKFEGTRALLDAAGNPLDALALPPVSRIDAILRWSALPGGSRHHWGTDVDLVDGAAIPAGYRVQLTAAEFAAGGPFAPLHAWLEANAARFGFFRPFRGVRSGVQPEPWHYSFAPVAESARRALTVEVLAETLRAAPLLGREDVLARIGELHAHYVARIDLP